MATQVITRTLCDFCQADDVERPDAERVVISIDANRWEVDVCKTHGQPLQDLADTLAEHGRKVPMRPITASTTKTPRQARGSVYDSVTQADDDGMYRCPAEGCPSMLGNRGSLLAHARQVHKVTLAELTGQPTPFACERCHKRYPNKQGLAMHRRWHAAQDAQEPLDTSA